MIHPVNQIDLSVIIPVFNNETTIARLCTQLINNLEGLNKSIEVILVNDASRDNSHEIINRLAEEFPVIRGIHLEKNEGQNMAIFHGLKASSGTSILTMDADLQDSPDQVGGLIKALDDTTDVVFIKRIGQYQAGGRMLTSLVFKGFLQLLTGLHRKAGSYYILKRTIVDRMIGFRCKYPIMTVMAFSLSNDVKYLPASRALNEGVSAYTFVRRCRYAFRATYCALQCRFSTLK